MRTLILFVCWLLWPGLGATQARTTRDAIADLTATAPETRARAACLLMREGDRAADAIPQLVELLQDASPVERSICDEQRRAFGDNLTTPGEQAAAALVAIGSRSYQPLLSAIRRPQWTARRNAAWALGALDDSRAVPALIAALGDTEASVREQVAWALGALDAVEAVDALSAAIKDPDARVRRQVAWALGAIGDRRAVKALIQGLSDSDANTREQAAWALGAIGDPAATDGLVRALKDEHVSVRRQAAWALGAIGK